MGQWSCDGFRGTSRAKVCTSGFQHPETPTWNMLTAKSFRLTNKFGGAYVCLWAKMKTPTLEPNSSEQSECSFHYVMTRTRLPRTNLPTFHDSCKTRSVLFVHKVCQVRCVVFCSFGADYKTCQQSTMTPWASPRNHLFWTSFTCCAWDQESTQHDGEAHNRPSQHGQRVASPVSVQLFLRSKQHVP